MIHDEAIKELFKEYDKADKRHYTDTFLSTMSSACWNSCLYVYATMKTFPLHSFKLLVHENHNLEPCPICSSPYEQKMGDIEEYSPTEINTDDIFGRLFVLRETNRTMGNSLADSDILIFIEIMKNLQQAEDNMKIRDIHKSLKKSSFFKQWKKKNNVEADYKLQAILETLGVCGILHTEKHTAPFYKYINLAVAPRSSHNSDWQYPVDFWKGKNGIDWTAFHYWFGEYEELKNENKLITNRDNA